MDGDPACWLDQVCDRCGRMIEDGRCGCPRVLLVDAANVVGSTPDGWWRDRPGAARRLVERLRAASATLGADEVVVVLEGQAKRGAAEGTAQGVRVVHAPGEGDDALAALAAKSAGSVTLVSADRALGERVRDAGADVVGPRWLLDQLAATS